MTVSVPHFDLPLRFHAGRAVVVEQDSPAEIANCVEVAARTRQGQRVEAPEFGLPAHVMQAGPLDADSLRAALVESEPRAAIVAERVTSVDDLRAEQVRVLIIEEEGQGG